MRTNIREIYEARQTSRRRVVSSPAIVIMGEAASSIDALSTAFSRFPGTTLSDPSLRSVQVPSGSFYIMVKTRF